MKDQVASALHSANENRLRRYAIRRDVMADRMTVAAALADPACATAFVVDVLSWQHRWGEHRAELFLRRTQVCTPFCRAGQLTERQRVVIARELRTSSLHPAGNPLPIETTACDGEAA